LRFFIFNSNETDVLPLPLLFADHHFKWIDAVILNNEKPLQ